MPYRARTPFAIVSFFGLSIAAIAACSVTTTDSGNNNDGGSSTPTPPTPPGTTGDSGSDSGANACAATADIEQCLDCCEFTQEAVEPADLAFDQCACGTDKCGTQCGASYYCDSNSTTDPTEECETCFDNLQQNDETCNAAYEAACEANAACKAAIACDEAAKCYEKPDPVDGGN